MERDMPATLDLVDKLFKELTDQLHAVREFQQDVHKVGYLAKCDLSTSANELLQRHQEIVSLFHHVKAMMTSVTVNLGEIVTSWKREMQMTYAEMVDSTTHDIKQITSWCGKAGLMIYDLAHNHLSSWANTLSEIQDEQIFKEQRQAATELTKEIRDMLKNFVQSTFVVTEQGKGFHIKTGNKTFPKFSIRLMALTTLPRMQDYTINAYFLSEDDINKCCHGNELDINQVKKADRKLKSNTQNISIADIGASCDFQSLQFLKPFKRKQEKEQKQVHEEKHRVVFVTTLNSETYWTMSLPLVVITASNQEAHCLASIMWQCYSTDVFAVPINIPDTLPWKRVADMLKTKMTRLSTSHCLTYENIEHLKNRLFGREGVSDEEDVNLTMFCWATMAGSDEERPFSFWKWFLAIYNLIQKFLTPYWNDGLIVGFIKKETAKHQLEANSDQIGTFILRFSDKYITPSDGVKGVFGHLTSCVRIRDCKGNKRKLESQIGTVKQTVESFEVANCERLKNVTLANLLRETWVRSKDGTEYRSLYCYHFPSHKSREELFDKHDVKCKNGIDGYIGTTDAGILCLEVHLQSVTLADTTAEDFPVPQDDTGGKKQKSRQNMCPIMSQMLTEPSGHSEIADLLQLCSEDPSLNIPTIVQNLPPVTAGPNSSSMSSLTSQTNFTGSTTMATDTLSSLKEVIDTVNISAGDFLHPVTVGNNSGDTRHCGAGEIRMETLQSSDSTTLMMGEFSQSAAICQSQMIRANVEGNLGTTEELQLGTDHAGDQQITVIIEQDRPEIPTNQLSDNSPAMVHLNGLRPYLTEVQHNCVLGWVLTHCGQRL